MLKYRKEQSAVIKRFTTTIQTRIPASSKCLLEPFSSTNSPSFPLFGAQMLQYYINNSGRFLSSSSSPRTSKSLTHHQRIMLALLLARLLIPKPDKQFSGRGVYLSRTNRFSQLRPQSALIYLSMCSFLVEASTFFKSLKPNQ